MNLLAAKRIENNNLKQVAKEFPRLFRTETYVDDQKFLDRYGIFIPEKKNLPKGYIKLWPQDFIVEEISLDGNLQDIYHEKFLSTKKEFSYGDPVIYTTLVKCGLSTLEAAEELAKELRVNIMTIYRYIKAGKLKAYKIGKEFRIDKEEFNKFLNKVKTK